MSVAARILGFVRAPGARPGARPATPVVPPRRAGRPARFAAEFKVPFQAAIDFHRQKVRLPTRTYRDLAGKAHDRGFAVAGATRDALLADLHLAVDDAIAGGMRLEQFQARFEEIVAKHGWTGWTGEGTARGRAWRARVIYDTNLRTAYAAGRYTQMTHPDTVRVRPYWMYVHGDSRTPLRPRPQHKGWHGLVLAWDDPWWQTHYPPNGWLCSCGIRTVSRRELTRMDKAGPDAAPAATTRAVKDPVTGDIHNVPQGIDFGWDHTPGRSWADGLVPRPGELPVPAGPAPSLPPLADISRPIVAPVLEKGQSTAEYVGAFLREFGADVGQARMFRDAFGQAVLISDDLFRAADGGWKLAKGARGPHLLRLADAIRDPDELWVDWAPLASGGMRLVRRYLRYDPEGGGYVVFEWGGDAWSGVTAFPPYPGRSGEAQARYLDKYRSGELLYRRKQ